MLSQLQELARFAQFDKDLGTSGAMGNENQVLHRIVVGRDIVKRMVVDRCVCSDLTNLYARPLVAKSLRLSLV